MLPGFLKKSNNYICIYRVLHININTEVGTDIAFYFHCHFNDLMFTFVRPCRLKLQAFGSTQFFLQDVAGAWTSWMRIKTISCFPCVTLTQIKQFFFQEMCYFIHLLLYTEKHQITP